MFQNIADENTNEIEQEDVRTGFNTPYNKIVKEIFELKNILLYILSFLISIVGFGEFGSPFALAIFAAVCSNKIPSGIVYILTGVGVFSKFGASSFLMYLFSSLVFILSSIIFKPDIIDSNRNEKRKLGSHLLLSSMLVQIVPLFFGQLYLYNVLSGIAFSILSYIFYKIFANGIVVIREYRYKAAFSIEEIMAACILLTIGLSVFGNLSIAGFSITSILCILMVLILGWKNGVLVGVTAGTTIGIILAIIGAEEPILVAAYAISGLMAGILNRLGKIGAILGFVIGNLIFAYIANGATSEIIHLKEIIIASLVLILIPKNIEINITDLIGKTKLLPNFKNRMIEKTEDTVYKLNNMSETISELADTYKEVAATTAETLVDVHMENRNIFVDAVFSNIEAIPDNILYEDITNVENGILDEIFDILTEQNEIDFKDIIEVFEKRNSYVLSTDDKETKRNIEKDVWRVIKLINSAYGISKVNFVWMQKSKENQKNISNQLEGISKVINSAIEELVEEPEQFMKQKEEFDILLKQKDIEYREMDIRKQKNEKYVVNIFLEKCNDISEELKRISTIEKILTKLLEQEIVLQKQINNEDNTALHIYSSKDKYNLQIGISKIVKNKSCVSGDSNLQIKLDDGKYLLALSDGMGSGPNAKRNSQIAIKMLKRLLASGFERDASIKLINSTICLNTTQEMYSTLDVSILDLYSGNIEIVKNGAMPTFIKSKEKIQVIDSNSLPAGIVENIDLVVHDMDLKQGDIIVMCTDGIIESRQDEPNWLEGLLSDISVENVQKIADLILNESIDNNFGLAKDDMTVIVGKII